MELKLFIKYTILSMIPVEFRKVSSIKNGTKYFININNTDTYFLTFKVPLLESSVYTSSLLIL